MLIFYLVDLWGDLTNVGLGEHFETHEESGMMGGGLTKAA